MSRQIYHATNDISCNNEKAENQIASEHEAHLCRIRYQQQMNSDQLVAFTKLIEANHQQKL